MKPRLKPTGIRQQLVDGQVVLRHNLVEHSNRGHEALPADEHRDEGSAAMLDDVHAVNSTVGFVGFHESTTYKYNFFSFHKTKFTCQSHGA